MADAIVKQATLRAVDWTAGSATPAGTVAVVAGYPYVTHVDAAANETVGVGAIGGVYEMTASAAIAAGAKVFWDNTAKKLVGGNGGAGNAHFGRLTPSSSASADGDKVTAIHDPDGSAGTA